MLKYLFSKYHQFRLDRAWKTHPARVALYRQAISPKTNAHLSVYPDELKMEIIQRIIDDVQEAVFSENPILETRKHLVQEVMSYSELKVLSLDAEEKQSAFYSDSIFISSELREQIHETSCHNEFLRNHKKNFEGADDAELLAMAQARTSFYYFRILVFDEVRKAIEPASTKNDWLDSFVEHMMIWYENDYRSKIGLGSIVGNDLTAMKHKTFATFVLKGSEDPVTEWETNFCD